MEKLFDWLNSESVSTKDAVMKNVVVFGTLLTLIVIGSSVGV
jgi:hypothetical protein